MEWEYRGFCQSKDQAIKILAEQIEYIHHEKDYLTKEVMETLRGEMEGFAAEWSIPFCWELHEQLLDQRSSDLDSWEDSGCGYDSWNDSGCTF